MVTLYVIEGVENRKRYVGITDNLGERLKKHRTGTTKAGIMLGKFNLIHTETFDTYQEARIREKYLKSGRGREWLERNSLMV